MSLTSLTLWQHGVVVLWHRGVVVITTVQFYSTKPEFRFCRGSNPACGMSEIRDGEDLGQWSWLEIRQNAFRQSTIPQKQFIIINIITTSLELNISVILFLDWYTIFNEQ